ncbi:response regulator transcription factor [Actinokineospora xionganensis]|uniref:Response regulator transcription factor n=1 Tax=Actinokineospora xionganensis TaxID=2684470 RepID=A0ABR7L8P6_9PSEU|nr:response regulator transcription factor [Actinokineospora xionganensis]MBC6449019.1 response regulator transcription factor [Actinokineospora xionganensis]
MRVVIVEDHLLLRDILTEGLRGRGVRVIGAAADVESAARLVYADPPDVVLLDIRLPPHQRDEGLCLAELVRSRHPEVGLLVLSSQGEVSFAQRLLGMPGESRALGYLLKERVGDLDELVDALHRVTAGDVVIDRELIRALMTGPRPKDPLDLLSPHERRVLSLVAQGRSNLGIAQHMACQVGTVEKHLSVITAKLGLGSLGEVDRRGVNIRVLATLAFLRGTGDLAR